MYAKVQIGCKHVSFENQRSNQILNHIIPGIYQTKVIMKSRGEEVLMPAIQEHRVRVPTTRRELKEGGLPPHQPSNPADLEAIAQK